MIGVPGFHCCGLGSAPGWGELRFHKLCRAVKKQNETKTEKVSGTAAPAYCLETVSKYQSWKGDAAQVQPTENIEEMGPRGSKTDEAPPQGHLQKNRGSQQHPQINNYRLW